MNWTIISLSVLALAVVLTLTIRNKKLKEFNFKFGFFKGIEMNYKFYKWLALKPYFFSLSIF